MAHFDTRKLCEQELVEQDSTIERKRPPIVTHFPNDMNVVPTKTLHNRKRKRRKPVQIST